MVADKLEVREQEQLVLRSQAIYARLSEGSVTARFGVRDFEIQWISGGFLDFSLDFWISGFQSGFLDLKVDFWISSRQADFWISKRISGFRYF